MSHRCNNKIFYVNSYFKRIVWSDLVYLCKYYGASKIEIKLMRTFVWLVGKNGISAISSISYRRLLFHVHACFRFCWNKMVHAHWALLRPFQKPIINVNFSKLIRYSIFCWFVKFRKKISSKYWKKRVNRTSGHGSENWAMFRFLRASWSYYRILLWQLTVRSVDSLKISWIVIWNM